MIKKDFGCTVGDELSDEVIDVSIGFVTDFASLPRLLWWILPKWGKYGNAAVIHDYLYWKQSCSKKRADDIFYEAMKVLKVDRVTAWIFYKAVCWFGCFAWHSNLRQKEQGFNKVLEKFPEKVFDWKLRNICGLTDLKFGNQKLVSKNPALLSVG